MENICYILCPFCVVCVESVKICEDLFFLCGFTHMACFFSLWVLRNLRSFTLVDNNEGKQMSSCDWGSHFVLINPLLLFSTRSGVRAKGICFVVHRKPITLKLNFFPHVGWKDVAIQFARCSLYVTNTHGRRVTEAQHCSAVTNAVIVTQLIFSLHKNKTFIIFQRYSSLSNERSLIFTHVILICMTEVHWKALCILKVNEWHISGPYGSCNILMLYVRNSLKLKSLLQIFFIHLQCM